MELLKRLIWTAVVVLLFGVFAYGGIQIRNIIIANNYITYWQQEQLNEGNFTLVVMGDSISTGVGASSPSKSFVGLIADNIRSTTGRSVRVVNLATPKATFKDILVKQIPKSREQKTDMILISAGRDDINGKSFDLLTLKKLLESLPSVDSYITEIPANYDSQRNKTIEIVNKAIGKHADSLSINVIPLYNVTSKSIFDLSYYDWDFVHPNDKGHKLWADTIWNEMK